MKPFLRQGTRSRRYNQRKRLKCSIIDELGVSKPYDPPLTVVRSMMSRLLRGFRKRIGIEEFAFQCMHKICRPCQCHLVDPIYG